MFSEGSTRTVESVVACAKQWRDLPCDAVSKGASPDCAAAGTLALGEKCINASQCASRACDGFNAMCGVCVDNPIECDAKANLPCPAGQACYGNHCIDTPASGPAADAPELGDACVTGAAQTCGDSFCKPDGAGDDGVCSRWPRLGEDCASALKCEEGDSYCGSSLTCVALPAANAACAADATGILRCASGSYCDVTGTTFQCRAVPKAGGVCRGVCDVGLACTENEFDGVDGKCVRRRMPGDSCGGPDDLCLPGATRCEGGVCVLVATQDLYETACMP
jgi:hypothetical protein